MEVIDGYDPSKLLSTAEKFQSDKSQTSDAGTQTIEADIISNLAELREAKERLRQLEMKIEMLENRLSKKYPDVNFLNYKNRKRILVC